VRTVEVIVRRRHLGDRQVRSVRGDRQMKTFRRSSGEMKTVKGSSGDRQINAFK
jgi:hypothetical protein